MATHEQDDYLVCKEYKEQIHQKSTEYPGFITFKHDNGNHYFAWVNNDEIILRSEAYPDADKMERGIKAILKNCDLTERYSVDEVHGAHFLILWGGGEEQHTGNRPNHSEIGRSCPQKSKEALNHLLHFKGVAFAQKVVPIDTHTNAEKPLAAAAAAVAGATIAASSATASNISTSNSYSSSNTSNEQVSSNYSEETTAAKGGIFKWLLPLLIAGLIGLAAWFLFKDGCGDKKTDTTTTTTTVKTGSETANKNVANEPKATYDSVNKITVYDEGTKSQITLTNSVKLDSVGINGFENKLIDFIKNGKIDTINKKANWISLTGVNFVTNKTDYIGSSAIQVSNVGKILQAYPNTQIKIGGHTDKSGDSTKNLVLSQQRAEKVKKDILAAGATPSQIKEAVGYGGEFAVADITDKPGMAKDRRVSVKVSKQ